MGTIRINNKTYAGNNITVNNNKVYIDGKLQEQDPNEKNISIVVEGDLAALRIDMCDKVEVKGSVSGGREDNIWRHNLRKYNRKCTNHEW